MRCPCRDNAQSFITVIEWDILVASSKGHHDRTCLLCAEGCVETQVNSDWDQASKQNRTINMVQVQILTLDLENKKGETKQNVMARLYLILSYILLYSILCSLRAIIIIASAQKNKNSIKDINHPDWWVKTAKHEEKTKAFILLDIMVNEGEKPNASFVLCIRRWEETRTENQPTEGEVQQ